MPPRHPAPAPLALALSLSAAAAAPLAAQQTPTPELLQQNASQCPADARIKYDATSIAGTDGVRWELRRGTAGSPPSWNSAEEIDRGQTHNSAGNRAVRLRDYGATLDGTPYLARVRAQQEGQPIADWSGPATYAPSYQAGSDMFSATPVTTGDPPQLRLQWSLSGALAACADRIRYEIKKDATFASATASDPNTFMAEGLTGASGERLLPIVGGPGDYYVRIVAQYGGEAPANEVGLRSPAIRVTFPAPVTTHAVDVRIVDGAASTCAASVVFRQGATAQLSGGGRSWTGTTDAQGRVRFDVPAGTYMLQASHQGCSSAHTTVVVSGAVERTLTLANCDAQRADLLVALGGETNPVGGRPYALPITLRNQGTGPSLAGQVVLRRLDGSGATAGLGTWSMPSVCPGHTRSYDGEDPAPAAGQTYTYTVQTSVADANNANNQASRRVSFSYLVVVNPVVPTTATPTPVSISSFAIRNGLPHVTVNRTVQLNATASGSPTEYRSALDAGGCAGVLAEAQWRAWSATQPPTWSSSTSGGKRVCFQLRRGSGSTAVASEIMQDDITVVRPSWSSQRLGTTATPVGAPLPNPDVGGLSCGSKFAVGVDTRAGQYVDAVALRCADLGPAGEHSNATTTGFIGGPGGRAANLRCQSGEVLARVEVRYGLYIDRIAIGCRTWQRDSGAIGTLRQAGAAGGTGGDQTARADCPTALGVTRFPDLVGRAGVLPGTGPFVTALSTFCVAPPGL